MAVPVGLNSLHKELSLGTTMDPTKDDSLDVNAGESTYSRDIEDPGVKVTDVTGEKHLSAESCPRQAVSRATSLRFSSMACNLGQSGPVGVWS
mmetsp:Transcript_136129/g.236593  ORF Transcript_136129/g.236593 Transcript_136129/m.236593 type:complete len:93 (-) Transcript_136129:1962-2240(-)